MQIRYKTTEILALLNFEPVPRRFKKEGGWTPQMQRPFIAKLAVHGSPGKACNELKMYRSGIDKVFHSAGAESFRDAWAAAVELADRRRAQQVADGFAGTADLKMPFVDNRRKEPVAEAGANDNQPLPGQVMNEFGQWGGRGFVPATRRGSDRPHRTKAGALPPRLPAGDQRVAGQARSVRDPDRASGRLGKGRAPGAAAVRAVDQDQPAPA